MSRSITFNGITKFKGGISRVNAEGLTQIGVSSSGALGIIGEAEGGLPGSVGGLVSLRDPAQAVDLFTSGPIVDAIRLAFQSSGDPLIPGGAAEVVIYKTNQSLPSSVHLPDLDNNLVSTTVTGGGSTSTVVNVAATLVASAHIDRWVQIQILASPGTPTYLRRITANTTSSITITPALPTAPAASDPVLIRATLIKVTSRDYGAHTNDITATIDYDPSDESYQVVTTFDGVTQMSNNLGGQLRNYLHVVYRGGTVDDSSTVVAGSTTTVINVTPGSLVSAAHVDKTFVLKDSSGNVKAYSKILTNGTGSVTLVTADALTVAPDVGDLIDILGVTNAVGSFTGASGVSTAFTTTLTGVAGDDLNISITTNMTINQLASSINSHVNYIATVPPAINGDTQLATAFDFGTSTQINLQTSFAGTIATTGFRQDLKEIVEWINDNSTELTAVRYTVETADGGDGNVVDYPGTTGDSLPWVFNLFGGARGISANSDFQAGFDAMLLRIVDEVIPLIDEDLVNEGNGSTATWASVSQQLLSHVISARGAAGLERGGWLGLQGTKTEIIVAANGLNDQDIALCGQNPTVLSTSGDLVEKGPRELAVMGASMRLGVPDVGEPLTNKFLRVTSLTQDTSWNPADVTDIADMVNAGVMFAETIAGQGVRWFRDLTTWVRDDNLAFSEGSVRDVVRFVVYGLRTGVENRFTGRRAVPATVASVKDFVVSLMEVYRTANIIVDSTDPVTGTTIKAYHSLKVFFEGDVARINLGIFPVPGINFELIDLFLSLPTQSA